MLGQADVRDDVFNEGGTLLAVDAADSGEVPESLLNGHLIDQVGVLWAVADHPLNKIEVLRHLVSTDHNLTEGRLHFIGQGLEGSRLAGTIDTEESQGFTLGDTEGQV